jgi:hypothetical protein
VIVELGPSRWLDVATGTVCTVSPTTEAAYLGGERVQVFRLEYRHGEAVWWLYGEEALAAVRGLCAVLDEQRCRERVDIPPQDRTAAMAEAVALSGATREVD